MPKFWDLFDQSRVSSCSDHHFARQFPFRQDQAGFLEDFRLAAGSRFFFMPDDSTVAFRRELLQLENLQAIVKDGQSVLDNNCEILGSPKMHIGKSIDWMKDFRSEKQWPAKKLSRSEILDLNHESDIKRVWELSRFHQVWWLGKAYWATNDERYAEKFGELVGHWILHNPVGFGPNWANAMEVSIRSCNWIMGYCFFCASKSLSDEFWMRLLKSLYSHGRFVQRHLEYAPHNGNHLISDIVGLLTLGLFFRSAPFGERWVQWAVRALQEEMETQVYPDGVNYEKSLGYHRFVLELFYTATILCKRNSIPLKDTFLSRLEKMFDFVLAYTRPDGSAPLVGDADDGRLFRFSASEDFNDHRHALSVGAVLFNRPDFGAASNELSQDVLWLFGADAFIKYRPMESQHIKSAGRAFIHGGFYILRSADAHVFIDADDIGTRGKGGHGHNDTLSFELWCDGSPLIVDSGTFAYTSDSHLRNQFRSTSAHNTIMVDGKELAEFAGLWSVRSDRTNPRVLDFAKKVDRQIIEAEHYGYFRRPLGTIHRRRIELMVNPFGFVVTDVLSGSGSHDVESFLHFAPGVVLERGDPRSIVAKARNASYLISVSNGKLKTEEGWSSPSYGVRERNQVLIIFERLSVPLEIKIAISRLQS